jgi:hypothetical protein
LTSREWPALPLKDWQKTCDTLHMWTQIVGKTRLKLTPHLNHWWNVTLYVTPLGLTTAQVPFGEKSFEVEFDFADHVLHIRTSEAKHLRIPLFDRSVADFYHQYMAGLRSFGIDVEIDKIPDEFADRTPFDEDEHHDSYDAAKVADFHRILVHADAAFKQFQARFVGKCSPVHFFWGSFDLAVTRFSGRLNPNASGSRMMKEAYSHEVSSCGFWPGDARFPEPAFYAYQVPTPSGLGEQKVSPKNAIWEKNLGEFLLRYDDVRKAEKPIEVILDFCQSTYAAGAELAKWDRPALERA